MYKKRIIKLLIALPFSYFVVSQNPSLATQATVLLPHISHALSFTIYYKERFHAGFNYVIPGIPEKEKSITIGSLKSATPYEYQITALNNNGKTIWTSLLLPLKD